MRTLKKALCLVLCLVMMVGLCAIGASAIDYKDYPDKDKIKYEEAVKVLTAIGVLQGDEGGYRPQDTLTRAEGAKIIVALQNVKPTGTSSFTDMDQAKWAQPYVAFLEAQGIVEGEGGGVFNPNGTLKFAEFAAMLLRTLGYDKDREDMTGPAYVIAVARLVNMIDLADGIGTVDYMAPITRDEAAQLAFNTLIADIASYDGNLTLDRAGNLALRSTKVPNAAYNFNLNDETEDPWLQLCEYFFPNLKCVIRWTDGVGVTRNWFLGKNRNDYIWTPEKEIAFARRGDVLARYERPGEVTQGKVWTDANATNRDYWLYTTENGYESAYVIGGDSEIHLMKNSVLPLPYAGTTATLVDTNKNGQGNQLFVEFAYLAMVSDVIPASESRYGERQVELTVFDGSYSKVTFFTDDFSKYDMVLAYPYCAIGEAAWGVYAVETAESISGTLTKLGLDRAGKVITMTVDGKDYPVAIEALAQMGLDGATVATSTYTLNKPVTLYMANGCVIGVTGEAKSYANYVFYMNDKTLDAAGKDIEVPYAVAADTNVYGMFGYVKQTGETGTAKVLLSAADPANAALEEEHVKAHEWGWYQIKYRYGLAFLSQGSDVTQIVASLDAGANLKRDLPGIKDAAGNKIITDNGTQFVLYTAYGFEVYTGLSNIPAYVLDNPADVYGLIVNRTGMAQAVFVDLHLETELDPFIAESVFILSTTPTFKEYDAENECTVYTYKAIVDGAFGTVKSTISGATGDEMAYGLIKPIRDENGYIVEYRFGSYTYASGKIKFSKDTLIIGDKEFATNSKTVVYFDSTTKRIEKGAAVDLDGRTGSAWVVPVSPTDKTASVIYVIG